MSLAADLLTALERRDPVSWIEARLQRNELNQPFALYEHQRAILREAFRFDGNGRLPYDCVVWACPKKSGKTTLNAAVVLWWALTQEAPNELYIVANDLDQATARSFSTVARLLRYNPGIDPGATVMQREVRLSNDTVIRAIASEYAGAAGSNHGLVSFDELWAYTTEKSQRLYEELTPVPTRQNSVRFISTYAGWEGESKLLMDLYKQGVGPEEHADGQGVRIHPEWPVYANADARLLIYWDHEPRLPWQTPAYYGAQRKTLRAGTYLRLHENRWATAEEAFITPELWDPNVDRGHHPVLPSRERPVFVGVDASTKHDSSAVVGVRWDGDKLALAFHRIFQPSPEAPLDLEATIEAELRSLHQRYHLQIIRYDPYQLHRSMTGLRQEGLPCEEYPQTMGNLTRAGQALFDLLNGRNLGLYPSDELRGQALNTVSVETPRGWRIAKDKASKKIDAIVALAMACVAALDTGNVVACDVSPADIERIQHEAGLEVPGPPQELMRCSWNGWRHYW